MAQYVDARVSRRKFGREIREFRARAVDYRARGWFLVDASFPKCVIVMAAAQITPPAIVTGVAFDYTNYDAIPPSVQLVNPFTFEPYLAKDLPIRLDRDMTPENAAIQLPPGMPQPKFLQPYMQWQSPDEIPFLCIAGVREYHEHPAHSGDAWELHRASGAGRLIRLLTIISRYGPEAVSQYQSQVQLLARVVGFQVEAPREAQ